MSVLYCRVEMGIERDVEAYAALAVALAANPDTREAMLAKHGLDEDGWEALERAWQDRFDVATDEWGEKEGIPPLVRQYAEAFARAQRATSTQDPLSFDRWIEVTRAVRRGGDLAAVLARLKVSLEHYLRSHEHWMRQVVADPALAARFHRAMLG